MRHTEAACPFCAASLTSTSSPVAPATQRASGSSLTRAAILFAGATAMTACGPTQSGDDASADVATDVASDNNANPDIVALYGPAPVDVQPQDAAEDSAGDVVALYGPAPVDGG